MVRGKRKSVDPERFIKINQYEDDCFGAVEMLVTHMVGNK